MIQPGNIDFKIWGQAQFREEDMGIPEEDMGTGPL